MLENLPFDYSSDEAKLFRRWDEIAQAEFAHQEFDRLLALADSICLRESPHYTDSPSPQGEAKIVEQLGTRGLKAAIESINGTLTNHDLPEGLQEELVIQEDTPLREPTLFGKSIDRSALAKAEQFGAQLMKESVDILGNEAAEMIEAFKSATTVVEQIRVIEWLHNRITEIALSHENTESVNDRDGTFYHPVRLSPRAIGSYPNTETNPTCLGVSVIAAGFFQATGADILHADVSEMESDAATTAILSQISYLRKDHLTDTPILHERAGQIYKQVKDHLYRQSARHAAVYVKLLDNRWLQFDPNFNATDITLFEHTDSVLTDTLTRLNSMKDLAPGLESLVALEGMYENIGMYTFDLNYRFTEQQITHLRDATTALYQAGEPESLGQHVYSVIVEPLIRSGIDDRYVRKGLMEAQDISNGDATEDLLQSQFHKLFTKYVLWGNSPDTFLETCTKDPNYLANRVTDTIAVTRLLLVSYAVTMTESDTRNTIHAAVEVGLPAQRLGLAVLSDFSQYTNIGPAPSFWLNNWAGDVSVTENLHRLHPLGSSWSSLLNNEIHRSLNPLTTMRNKDIIDLSIQQALSRDGDTHAQKTEGKPEEA